MLQWHFIDTLLDESHRDTDTSQKVGSFSKTILQIVLIDIILTFDSLLTPIGMTNRTEEALAIMIIAVISSMPVRLLFVNSVGKFVNKHPTVKILALSFSILIGFMLITEWAHLAHTTMFNQKIVAIPKGYLYFAIAFSLGVEVLNMKISKKKF